MKGFIVYEVSAALARRAHRLRRKTAPRLDGGALATRIGVLDILADRFIAARSASIDLATGARARVRVVPAGSADEQLAWSTRCARLANLRHPLINPLIDYGAADRDHLFEAYEVHRPLGCGGRFAQRLLAHAMRFLRANDIVLERPLAEFALRSIEPGPCLRVRPVGVVLQRRTVYDAIADALDAGGPGGTCAIPIEGEWSSGLRTLRLVAARMARLKGYVVLTPAVLRAQPKIQGHITGRHVCVISDAAAEENEFVVPLLTRLGAESARRHVWLELRRPAEQGPWPPVRIDPMGVVAMSGMVFVDAEQGPRPDELFEAAKGAEGLPGRCLASLGAYATEPVRKTMMVVHEEPQPYASGPTVSAPSNDRISNGRIASVFQRSVARSHALASRGRHASADRVLSRAARVLAGRGHRDDAARAALLLGWLALDRGRIEAAVHAFELARRTGPSARPALIAAIGLGVAWTDDGRLFDSEAALRSALVAAQKLGDPDLTLEAASALGRCLYWMGRFDEAAVALSVPVKMQPSSAAVRILAARARVHLAEGSIPAGVRAAQAAVEMATVLGDARMQAAACRVLAAGVAYAGDCSSAATHIADGLRAAARAHLPLAAVRLRLTLADIQGGSCPPETRRAIARFAGAEYPNLLRFCAAAVAARIEGVELDVRTRQFLATSGAHTINRPLGASAVNPVADLERFLEIGHAAADERAAIERIGIELQSRLRAATVLVLAGPSERRVVCATGRPWPGDPHIAWRAAASGVGVSAEATVEPCQAAEPLRYGGDTIGALAARWTAGMMVDPARVTSLLRVGALALAASVRAVLDRTVGAEAAPAWNDLLGDSPPTRALRESVARAARAPFPVLIEGESGSGKELVARAIHRLGPRRDRRFCALNCAALSDELIEAELFGHARGAFTGAVGERAGLFEEADGGTLFLDEIGELSARAQAKLLRVLQDGEVRRVGENVSRRVDVRIVAATNRRLHQEAASGRFRADLRFRLDVVRIEVPPLRERATDVPVLAQRFWNDAVARVGSRATLAPDAVAALARYDWPGNVRELQNVMAWMAVHSPGRGRVNAAALPRHVAQVSVSEATSFEAARADFERRFIKAALASADGQRSRAAEALGVTRQGLAKMIRRLGLDAE
jgi:DNA-binding NtrC family response regulator/tetratricopeptide (TPR) repeat protein